MSYPCSLFFMHCTVIKGHQACREVSVSLWSGIVKRFRCSKSKQKHSAELLLQRWDSSLTAESTHTPTEVCAQLSYTSWQFSITSAHTISALHSQTPSGVHLGWLGHRNTSQYTHWYILSWILSYLQQLVDRTHTSSLQSLLPSILSPTTKYIFGHVPCILSIQTLHSLHCLN